MTVLNENLHPHHYGKPSKHASNTSASQPHQSSSSASFSATQPPQPLKTSTSKPLKHPANQSGSNTNYNNSNINKLSSGGGGHSSGAHYSSSATSAAQRKNEKIQCLKNQLEKQMKDYAKQEEYEEMLKLVKVRNIFIASSRPPFGFNFFLLTKEIESNIEREMARTSGRGWQTRLFRYWVQVVGRISNRWRNSRVGVGHEHAVWEQIRERDHWRAKEFG